MGICVMAARQTLTLFVRVQILHPQPRKKDQVTSDLVFFQRNKSLTGFVKCTSCVKYASRVKCAAARDRGSREGIYFISHCDKGAIFHNVR